MHGHRNPKFKNESPYFTEFDTLM